MRRVYQKRELLPLVQASLRWPDFVGMQVAGSRNPDMPVMGAASSKRAKDEDNEIAKAELPRSK